MRIAGRGLESDEGPEPLAGVGLRTSDPYPRWALALFAILTVAVVAAWVLLAVSHIDDRFIIDHVSGVRMALARYAHDGTLYPELYRDGLYGGTRFMPLPIVLHSALARVTGEYLVSGRIFGYLTTIALVLTTLAILRRRRCPLGLRLLLSILVLTTGAGLAASMNLRADLLPLLLQLLAVWIVSNDERTAPTTAAAGLSALALMAKLSAVWAPIAIVVWLIGRDRRRLAWYVTTYVGAVAVLSGVFGVVSGGRIFENVLGLSTAGVTGLRSFALAPYRFVHLLVGEATTMWAVVPLAAVGAWYMARRQHDSIYVVSALCALAVTLVVLVDVGTGANQIVDLIVLLAVVIGTSTTRIEVQDGAGPRRIRPIAAITGSALFWVVATGSVVTLGPPVLSVIQGEAAAPKDPLAGRTRPGTSVLSEDPYVPLSIGQLPVVLDPFMLPRLATSAPKAIPDLVDRIERKEFDLVVLVEPLEPIDREWWTELDLGTDVVAAISRSYAFVDAVDGYFVYQPRPIVPGP